MVAAAGFPWSGIRAVSRMKLMATVVKTEHPHIERRPGVCGGSPVIEGTRIPVRLIVGFVKNGIMTVEDIREAYPSLTLAQIYDALSYYHDHQAEIDEELRQNTLEYVLERHNLRLGEKGVLVPRSSR